MGRIVGVAIIYLGTYAGFNATILSPSPLGISQRSQNFRCFRELVYAQQFIYLFTCYHSIYKLVCKALEKSNKGSILGDNWFQVTLFQAKRSREKEVP